LILVITGPGGVGKGTVVRRLLELEPSLWLSQSWTTRPRRPGEPEDAYVFVSRDEFEARAAEGGFIEWAEVVPGQLSGTPEPHPPPGRGLLLEINVEGARQIKQLHKDAVVVLIVAPSVEEQEARMRRRGDSEEQIAARLALGKEEERLGRELADAVVVNDNVDRAARQVAGILHRYR
jgi:guanylate kinase